jgi:hypothetical protein
VNGTLNAVVRWLLLLVLAACSRSADEGRVIVAVTVDWEGAELNPDGLDAIDYLRKHTPGPVTHFVSAAYFTKAEPEPVIATFTEMIRPDDELAVHLHAWRSLAKASGLEPRTSPSMMTGGPETDDYDGDTGFETDLDTYDVAELRAMLQTSRRLLEQSKRRVSRSFRAGGFLGTPKMFAALRSEGYTSDSSALDHGQIDLEDPTLGERLAGIWPRVNGTTRPFLRDGLVEIPITAFADFSDATEVATMIDASFERLRAVPAKDQFVVLAFNLETAATLAGRIGEGLEKARAKHPDMVFVTIEHAAELARQDLGVPPP